MTPGWSCLEHDAIDRLTPLGPIEIAVYVALLRHVDTERRCFPSMARIAAVAGITERRARTAVSKLVAAGLVRREGRLAPHGGTLSPMYCLPLLTPRKPAEQNDTGGCFVPGGAEQNAWGGWEQNYPLTRTNRTRCSARAFKKPSIDEIRGYCHERKNHVDPQRFLDYYESNGWRVGRNAMQDWRAAIRTWEKNGFSNGNGNGEAKKPEKIKYRDEAL